jgi:hypothetical protein
VGKRNQQFRARRGGWAAAVVVLAAAVAATVPAGPGQGSSPGTGITVQHATETAGEAAAYWTPERLRSVPAVEMPTVEVPAATTG